MKIFTKSTILLLSLLFTQITFAQATVSFAQESNTVVHFADFDTKIKIIFFPHNEASINEFSKGRERVNAAIELIISHGFTPKENKLSIGIAPREMSGGDVVQGKNALYIFFKATDESIEAGLLKHFNAPKIKNGKFSYFPHNDVGIKNFLLGVDLVNKVLDRIIEAGFELNIEGLEVGIAPREMSGGPVVESAEKLFVFYMASEEHLERKLLKYFVWPN